MILTTSIPVGAAHHFSCHDLDEPSGLAASIEAPGRDFHFSTFGNGGVPDRTGFPITFRLGEQQYLAVRMDLGTSCACGPKQMARCYRSQLFLSPLVLEARTARWVLDAVHALLSLRTQGNTSSPQPAWIVQIGSFDAPQGD